MFEWLSVAAVLLFFMSGSNAEFALSQPLSLSIVPGGNVEISCTLTGVNLGNAAISWYQQKPNNAPRYVLYHNTATVSRGSGTPDRFSGRSDSSANTRYLTISRVQAEDEADYYCAVWIDSAGVYIFGSGTRLSAQTRAKSRPSVSLLPPAPDQISAAKTATLVCLVNNFFPSSVQVSWSVDDKATETGVQTTQAVADTNKMYSVSSYLTLSAAEWNSHEVYTCGVTHESLESELQKSIKRSACQ
ncbi:immunoglobulin lambda-1 light chain-like [Mustelus asterias]